MQINNNFNTSKLPKFLYLFFIIFTISLQQVTAKAADNKNDIIELIRIVLTSDQKAREKAENQILGIGKSSVTSLLKAFRGGSYSERNLIGNLIIKIGDDAVPTLESALLSEDEDLASNSAILLGEIGASSIPSLKRVLSDKRFSHQIERQREAAYALGRIGPSAYPAMIELITGIDEPSKGTFFIKDALIEEGKATTSLLAKALKNPDPILRLLSAIILGNIKDASSLSALIDALNDKDSVVCTQVAVAISALGNRANEAVPFIVNRLNELETKEPPKISEELRNEIYVNFQEQAIYALDKIGAKPEEVFTTLIRYMQHHNADIRSAATYVVGKFKKLNGERVVALINASNDIKGEVRKKAIDSFGEDDIENTEVFKTVLLKLKDPYPSVRGSAAKTLGRFKNKYEKSLPLLIDAVQDEDAYVRSQAASSLGDFRDNAQSALPFLIRALDDNDQNVRNESIKAIGKIGVASKEILDALQKSFLTEIDQNQIEAANALKSIGLESVPVFLKTLKNDDENIRIISADKLGEINPKAISAIPDLINSLHNISAKVRENSAKSLGQIGPSAVGAVSGLIYLLHDKEESVCKAAIDSLGKIGPNAKDSIPKLIELSKNENINIQTAAINTIGKFGEKSQSAVFRLVELIETGADQILNTAIVALGNIGPAASEAVPTLIQLLNHEKRNIKAEAAKAIGFIGAKAYSAIPYLINALYDENQEVKYRAADALADISKDLSDKKHVSTISQLEEISRHFEICKDLETERYPKNEHYKTLIREINHLKTLRILNILNYGKRFVAEHPILTFLILAYILWIGICHIILLLSPLTLFNMNKALEQVEWQIPDWLGGGGLKIKFRFLLYFGFLNYRKKVLDGWILKHIINVSNRFKEKRSVKLREIYIPMPISINETRIQNLTHDSIRPEIHKKNCCILISGEGGVGKTSLAFQIARWAISEKEEERFFEHPMIPVIIENDLLFSNTTGIDPLMNAIFFSASRYY